MSDYENDLPSDLKEALARAPAPPGMRMSFVVSGDDKVGLTFVRDEVARAKARQATIEGLLREALEKEPWFRSSGSSRSYCRKLRQVLALPYRRSRADRLQDKPGSLPREWRGRAVWSVVSSNRAFWFSMGLVALPMVKKLARVWQRARASSRGRA
ncbi:hypothetical protein GDI2603 [Gluconacetobacter diazotrophicus PA1 5]|uniref:Uncharacterized protein n=1 Tax=Gluconacetobacter diazotrophicus (strain ATCC 49037 / DSM 5601 / CCUG 37298 / CIP 103539 / LMG 7603 / PAl5) TaxID=272568 RepID=A9HP54_GLUDA|nr:hypothetical protein GDI2603 [Gluconacetobacter diazotrophicus PA1 5]